MAKEYKDLVVGLDIGTSKIMVVVAEITPDGALKLAGLGVAPSNGLKRGVVVNIDATVQSIQQALKEAELMADCRIARVSTGITGSHIRGINSSGMVAIKDREVMPADVARVIETAKAIHISTDQRLLLVEPQEFVIDGQDVKEPIGMSGIRLEAKVHIVTGAQSAAENIIKCVRRCGLEVDQLMLNPLASSQAILTEDERELGVALVDIGAGTTDVAIFAGGAIRYTAVIPIAGDLITSDIAMALRTPTKDAEDIKVESGCAKQLLADPLAQVEVPGLGDRGPRMLGKQALAGVGAQVRGVEQLRGEIGERPVAFVERLHGQQHAPHVGMDDDRVGGFFRGLGAGQRAHLQAVVGVPDRALEARFAVAQPLHPGAEPRVVHHGEHAVEAFVRLADQKALGPIEVQHAGGRGLDPHLVLDGAAMHRVALARIGMELGHDKQ